MKKILPITLTLLLVLFAGTAMADKGARIERHLDAKGDRIERQFDRKAAHAADHGKYRQAAHFQAQGDRIDRHLDHKGRQIHQRYDRRHDHRAVYRHDHRAAYRHDHRHIVRATPVVAYPVYERHYSDNVVSLLIQQPGFMFGLSSHY